MFFFVVFFSILIFDETIQHFDILFINNLINVQDCDLLACVALRVFSSSEAGVRHEYDRIFYNLTTFPPIYFIIIDLSDFYSLFHLKAKLLQVKVIKSLTEKGRCS